MPNFSPTFGKSNIDVLYAHILQYEYCDRIEMCSSLLISNWKEILSILFLFLNIFFSTFVSQKKIIINFEIEPRVYFSLKQIEREERHPSIISSTTKQKLFLLAVVWNPVHVVFEFLSLYIHLRKYENLNLFIIQ